MEYVLRFEWSFVKRQSADAQETKIAGGSDRLTFTDAVSSPLLRKGMELVGIMIREGIEKQALAELAYDPFARVLADQSLSPDEAAAKLMKMAEAAA